MSDLDSLSHRAPCQKEDKTAMQSKRLTVGDSDLHYLEQGSGAPILFLHGMPTSSYLWRHILPQMAAYGRCIAVDLIGMGDSAKPDIAYTTTQHIAYIEAFIEQLDLQQLTIVIHGWGSVIGLDYARRHPQRIAGLAFYEAQIRPVLNWSMLSLPVQQFASQLRNQQSIQREVYDKNFFIDKLLPAALLGEMQREDLAVYRQPFTEVGSRRPLWQYLAELPLGAGSPANQALLQDAAGGQATADETLARITHYHEWLQQTQLPKLMLYSMPGFNTTIDTVQWCRDYLPALTQVAIEDSLHFAQESQPAAFAKALCAWYQAEVMPGLGVAALS